MHIYFGTCVRGATLPDGGELVKLDWETKSVMAKAPLLRTLPHVEQDPHPRGNTQGYRGITIHDGSVVAATYHTLHVFDANLRHIRAISHGLMVDLHESHSPGDGTIWVSSTAIDAVLQYELRTGRLLETIWPRQMPALQRELNVTPSSWATDGDYRRQLLKENFSTLPFHLHLNAIDRWKGELYALFNRYGAIVNLSRSRTVLSDVHLRGAHNLLVCKDGTAITNDTHRGVVRRYDLATGKLIWSCSLLDHAWIRSLIRWPKVKYRFGMQLHKLGLVKERIARPLFVRGLAQHEDLLFLGMSPAAVVCLRANSGEFVDGYQFSKSIHVCIHGLCLAA